MLYSSLYSYLKFDLFGILRIPPFVNHKGNDVNSDWLADQWDERSVLGHAQFHKGRMKGDDPMILRSILRRLQSASIGVWLFWGKPERLSLIVSRTMMYSIFDLS